MELGGGSECRDLVLDELCQGERGPIAIVMGFSGEDGRVLRHVEGYEGAGVVRLAAPFDTYHVGGAYEPHRKQ